MKVEEENYIINNPNDIKRYSHLYQAQIWGNNTNEDKPGFISNIHISKDTLNPIYEDIPILVYKNISDDTFREVLTSDVFMQTDSLNSAFVYDIPYIVGNPYVVFYKHLINLTGEQIEKYVSLLDSLTEEEIEKYRDVLSSICISNAKYIEHINEIEFKLINKYSK